MAWTDEELSDAALVELPHDAYRLQIEGKEIDVPGWMVGDEKQVKLKSRAAAEIRHRFAKKFYNIPDNLFGR